MNPELPNKITRRQAELTDTPSEYENLFDLTRLPAVEVSERNTEALIGSVVLPVGVAEINFRLGGKSFDRPIPLATYEGVLVASISRGGKLIRESGGADVIVENTGVTRAPVFDCGSQANALHLRQWLDTNREFLEQETIKTSQHTHYLSHTAYLRGKFLYVRFAFDTDLAMGMNMATFAAEAIAQKVKEQFPEIRYGALSSNVCTDKKDSQVNKLLGRGYWAQAEVSVPNHLVGSILRTSPREIEKLHISKNLIGSNQAGSMSQNAQVANVAAAVFLATGQDPAHIVEASNADLTCSAEAETLYFALTLHSLLLGTVGGGTYLPAQTEARRLLGDGQDITPSFLAAALAVAALAGEISLLGSLSEGTLSQSHRRFARGKAKARG